MVSAKRLNVGFETVVTDVEMDWIAELEVDATPIDALTAGCLGWLEAVKDPAIHRILFVDGPVVLGWGRARSRPLD